MLRAAYLFVFGLVVTFATLACCQETSVENAMRVSRKTGKPIFAIASRKICPPCQILKSRVKNFLQSSPLSNQVVYLRVDLDAPQWNTWSQQFPHEGRSLPLVYLIRADNKKLYGQSNTLPGDQLEKFITQGIAHSGKSFSTEQVKQIEESNRSIEKAIDNDQVELALKWVATNSTLGKPGKLGSYAEPAIKNDHLVNVVADKSKQYVAEKIAAITKDLSRQSSEKFAVVYSFVVLEKSFGEISSIADQLSPIAVKLAIDTDLRGLWSDARKIYDANQTLAATNSIDDKKAAVNVLTQLCNNNESIAVKSAASDVMRRNASTVAQLNTKPPVQ